LRRTRSGRRTATNASRSSPDDIGAAVIDGLFRARILTPVGILFWLPPPLPLWISSYRISTKATSPGHHVVHAAVFSVRVAETQKI
jgi:hypothetical protein